MPVFTDQTGRKIELKLAPQRIISLVPSQTELLYSLGLEKEVAGITKFCVHPKEWFQHKIRIGGTKQLNIPLIHQLQPDLILANKEENVKEQVEELANHYPVWISDVNNIESALAMITEVGIMTGKQGKAKEIRAGIEKRFDQLKQHNQQPKTAYLIWRDPYMTVGGDTFIHAMLEAAGFENIFSNRLRYPEITIEELSAAGCQLVLLSSEPFPFKEKHKEEIQRLLPGTKIMLVDGELFSWYGSRMIQAAVYFEKIKRIRNKK
jgi:ABC-type Fe3+-hydroxamate transport system substrate-binding protein